MKKPNPTKKIHSEKLKYDAGLYLYQNEPYSGYSFEFSDIGQLIKVKNIYEGKDRGESNKLFSDPSKKRISGRVTEIDRKYGTNTKRYLFEGKEFEGFTYFFDRLGNLVEEFRIDSTKSIYRQWYSNGQIKLDNSNVNKHKTWYRNGQVKSSKVYEQDELVYSAKYYRNGVLYYLYIGDCKTVPSKIFFYENISDWFVLCGEGISDNLLKEWWKKKQHNSISRLSLMNTNISPKGISIFNTDYLLRLDLTGNKNLSPAWIVEFESQKPNCTVVFNNSIVEHEPKLRIHMSGLEDGDNKFFYEGIPFSGIAYKIDEAKKIPRIVYFKDGEAVENCRDVLARNRQILRVNRRYLKENVPFVNMGRPRYSLGDSDFTGVAYAFDNYRLLKEEFYTPERSIFREWYADGHIKLEKYKDLSYEWFVNGHLHRHVNGSMEEKYLRNGQLYWLKLDEEDLVDYYYFEKYELAKTVHLTGWGINDEALKAIFQKRTQENIEEVYIVNSHVSQSYYETLMNAYPHAKIIKQQV